METNVRTPLEIFTLPQRLAIPHFQRSYVWQEDEQWEPLWQDLRRLAELRLAAPGTSPTHFLGAVVVQSSEVQLGAIPTSNVIDGQQRLTTLSLLMDATSSVFDEAGLVGLVAQLELLTHNQPAFVQPGDSRLKLQHSNRDRADFESVMTAEVPIDYDALDHANRRIVGAHRYFRNVVSDWLRDEDGEIVAEHADALVFALTRGLQIVAISLLAGENSQAIFETLNARGTPLTAADLIKNHVFQRLESEDAGSGRSEAANWPFDTRFWEAQVSVGRYAVSRSSLFFNQWLIARTGEEVSPQSTFARFKAYAEHDSGLPMRKLLALIKRQADLYEHWTQSADEADRQLDPVTLAVYRMHVNGIEVLKPLLLWLHRPDREYSSTVIDEVVRIADSWLHRRLLLRLTTGDLGRVVAEAIRVHQDTAPEALPQAIRSFISRLQVSSTYWPGDAEIRETLRTEPAYRRYPRGRLRVFLEASEDDLRSRTNQPQVPRRGYPIEHILPQRWETNWPVDGIEQEQARAAHVHRLGNLTLLTGSLNSKVSNGPWAVKRKEFVQHNALILTSRVLGATEHATWDEQLIDQRTEELIDGLLRVWPVPDGHEGVVIDPRTKDAVSLEVRDLLAAGLLEEGAVLTPRAKQWEQRVATVRADGWIELEGKVFETPSGAARHVRGGATNGWWFWRVDKTRTLRDLRLEYEVQQSAVSRIS